MKKIITLLLAAASLASAQPTRVACVGDSITYGSGIKERDKNSYPAQLQKILGEKFEIKNFGVGGATMLNNGNKPYVQQPAYQASLDYQPNVVIIKLGSNDSKPDNWKLVAEFLPDTLNLIRSYQQLDSAPRVILCTPIPAYQNDQGHNVYGITDEVIIKQQIPALLKASKETAVELINLHQEYNLDGAREAMAKTPDRIHPNAAGAAVIAKRVAFQLINTFDPAYNVANLLTEKNIPYSTTNFHGYNQYNFTPTDTQLKCSIVAPHTPNKTHRWIWRARFFGHQPKLDQALLDRGYHVAYVDVADLFGAPLAVRRWDFLYAFTQTIDLHPKPILEGMSRGGLIIFNWAKQNPDKVTAIYGDNPVCDIRSWPAKKSPADWAKCLIAYGITAEQAADFKGNPIDDLDALAKANVPIMLSLGAKDDVVPIKDNALILSQRYRDLGGKFVQTWVNKNTGHHPHMACPFRELLDYTLATTNMAKKTSATQ